MVSTVVSTVLMPMQSIQRMRDLDVANMAVR
jgi:hypothetical protein